MPHSPSTLLRAVSPSNRCRTAAGKDRSRREVAEVFRLCGVAYRRVHPLSPDQSEVMQAIASCRTAALGGHLERCDSCGFERPAYNSCRNRPCPKCQSMAKAEWLPPGEGGG